MAMSFIKTLKQAIAAAAFVICMFSAQALAAASLTAVISADNGAVDFSPGASSPVANLSYSSNASQIYTVTITPVSMSTSAASKVLTITLPPGMRWVDDASGDTNVTDKLSGSVVNGPKTVVGSTTLGDGSRTYTFQSMADTVSVQIQVAMDEKIWSDALAGDVILTAEYVEDGASPGIAQLTAGTITNEGSFCVKKDSAAETQLLNPGVVYDPEEIDTTSNRTRFYMGPNYYTSISRLITKAEFTVLLSDADAALAINTASIEPDDSNWSVSDNGSGVYTFVWESTEPVLLDHFFSFFTFEFPSAVAWVAGDEAVVSYGGVNMTFYDPTDLADYQYEWTAPTTQYDNATLTFRVPPPEEYVYVNWYAQNIAEVNNQSKTATGTYYTTPGTFGTVGTYFAGNAGGVDSADKKITLNFNTTDVGVRGVYIPLPVGQSLENSGMIYIETSTGASRNVDFSHEVGAELGYEGNGTIYLSANELGLGDGEYLTKVVCYIGSIPATTTLGNGWEPNYINIIGDRLTDTASVTIGTVEIANEDDTNSTGAGAIVTEFSYRPTPDIKSLGASQTINAGETFTSCSVTVENADRWINDSQSLDDPIIYLRSLFTDGSGGYLEYENIKITNIFGDITGDCTITRQLTADGYLYTIDTSGVPDFGARLYPYTSVSDAGVEANKNILTVTWDIPTTSITPAQLVNYRSVVRVASPHADCFEGYNTVLAPGFTESTYVGVRPYNGYTTYLSIKGNKYISVATTARHENGTVWQNWEPTTNPVAIGFGMNTSFLIKTTITNNAGVEVNTPSEVYIPIPKYGDDWATLLYDDDGDDELDFGISLKGPVEDVNSTGYEIKYAVITTVTDSGSALQAQSWYTYDQLALNGFDIADVNCIQITAGSMGVGVSNDFIMDCRVDTNQPVTLVDGMTDVWRPLYLQDVSTTDSEGNPLYYSGWYYGKYIGIETALGELVGQVFYDIDGDGKFTAGTDSEITDGIWKISVYDDQNIPTQTIYTTDDYSATGTATGKYHFFDLVQDEDFYNIVAEPVTGNAYEASGYAVTILGTPGTKDNWNTDNQFTGVTGTAGYTGKATAVMPLIAGTETAAVYNLGITNGVAFVSNPLVEKSITGEVPLTTETFTFRLEAQAYIGSASMTPAQMPMPAGSSNGVKTITIDGEGTAAFGAIVYKETGTYRYRVVEVAGSNTDYTYSVLVYNITDTVTEVAGKLVCSRVITRSDGVLHSDATANLVFENVCSEEGGNPQTGDSRNLPLLLALALGSALLLSGLWWRRLKMK